MQLPSGYVHIRCVEQEENCVYHSAKQSECVFASSASIAHCSLLADVMIVAITTVPGNSACSLISRLIFLAAAQCAPARAACKLGLKFQSHPTVRLLCIRCAASLNVAIVADNSWGIVTDGATNPGFTSASSLDGASLLLLRARTSADQALSLAISDSCVLISRFPSAVLFPSLSCCAIGCGAFLLSPSSCSMLSRATGGGRSFSASQMGYIASQGILQVSGVAFSMGAPMTANVVKTAGAERSLASAEYSSFLACSWSSRVVLRAGQTIPLPW